MESTQSNGLINETFSLLKLLRLPRVDASAMLESRRKDIEALVSVNTTALTGMQTLARKQLDIVNARCTRLQSLIARKTDASEPKQGAGEAVQDAMRSSLSDMRELAETAYRVQADSFAVVSKRVAENVEEFKALLQSGK